MRKILIILLLLVSTLVITGPAQAAFGLEQTASNAGYNLGATDPASTVKSVVAVVLGFVAIVFFMLTLYAGVIWMFARGKEDQVESAKNILEAAVIGLIIVAAAYAVSIFVITRLTNKDITGCCTVGQTATNRTVLECQNLGGSWMEGKCSAQ